MHRPCNSLVGVYGKAPTNFSGANISPTLFFALVTSSFVDWHGLGLINISSDPSPFPSWAVKQIALLVIKIYRKGNM